MLSYRPGSPATGEPCVFTHSNEELMARACAVCGKVSMGGFNPQSSGMNRVRAHRRYQPNLQQLKTFEGGREVKRLVCTRCRRTLARTS